MGDHEEISEYKLKLGILSRENIQLPFLPSATSVALFSDSSTMPSALLAGDDDEEDWTQSPQPLTSPEVNMQVEEATLTTPDAPSAGTGKPKHKERAWEPRPYKYELRGGSIMYSILPPITCPPVTWTFPDSRPDVSFHQRSRGQGHFY